VQAGNVVAATVPFPDMEKSWYRYREAVEFLHSREVISGYPDGTFQPHQPINRVELLKIVFKGRSDVTPVQRRCFSDINPDAWYAPYVCAAERRGIVDGYPDGTYKPERTVNFAEAIKIILNAYEQDIAGVEEVGGERWYAPYVNSLDERDIFDQSGYLPWEDLTRERAADLLARILRYEEERVIPRLSSGCGKAPLDVPSTVTVNGMERQFLLTVPRNYVAHDPVPLIIAFHGRTNSNEQVRKYYGLDREGTEFLIAYPAALANGNGSFSWSAPGDKNGWVGDVAFFDALVETLAGAYCVDMDRIFVVGHSLGAWMANSVACIRGDIVRASGTVGGSSIFTKCAGPNAALLAHNPKDNLASFSETARTRDQLIKENFCAPESDPVEPVSLSCQSYRFCVDGNALLWCPHTIDHDERGVYYPHTWPPNFEDAIIQFFRSQD
jgi:polyhydroxybutyrate depolymerase